MNKTSMKRWACAAILVVMTLSLARGAVITWSSGFDNGGYIPDGAPTGWSDTRTVSGLGSEITDVKVTLNVSGGYNGDLYVYLAYNGETAVLLNRVGRSPSSAFGYGDAGFNVTFNDNAAQSTDFHSYRSVSGYSISSGAEWRPDGRVTDPAFVLDSDPRTKFLSSFNGMNPNGAWTLFAADLSGGAVAHIDSWGLDIEASAVPEPVNRALTLFGLLLLCVTACRCRRRPQPQRLHPRQRLPRRQRQSQSQRQTGKC